MPFPIDVSAYRPLHLEPGTPLTAEQFAQWTTNIDIVRDTIVFFTAVAGARGLSGHTGGAYDVVPEALLADGFTRGSDRVYPVLFDEAGHRVALQYALAAFNEQMDFERLLHYREEGYELYGHPELAPELGIRFASGRLGHMWPFCNGVAMANPGQAVVVLGSDGSQMEGNDAEAARLAVAQELDVKLLIDDNDVTIAGHPSRYLPGFDVGATLRGHGLPVDSGDGEDFEALAPRVLDALAAGGPSALVNKRPMAVGLPGIAGEPHGHEVIGVADASAHLEARGHDAAVAYLADVAKHAAPSHTFLGSSDELASNRKTFGSAVSDVLDELAPEERVRRIRVIDTDLEGSTGLSKIHERHPEVFVSSGIMERGNLSAAAGFGYEGPDRTGVFSTFSAFLEMVVSEISMARLNDANLLCHFSHAGVDAIADNTCHFGVNVFFADNGLEEQDPTPLYFPADAGQLTAVVRRVLFERGLRFLFSVRSELPYILGTDGEPLYDPEGYDFEPGRDLVVREGTEGYVISYGEMLHRALDAVERFNADGHDVGLINKVHLNAVDDEVLARVGASGFALVVEGQNRLTGLGSRYGTWLLERGHSPRYAHLGVHRIGSGGTWAQVPAQGLDGAAIGAKLSELSA